MNTSTTKQESEHTKIYGPPTTSKPAVQLLTLLPSPFASASQSLLFLAYRGAEQSNRLPENGCLTREAFNIQSKTKMSPSLQCQIKTFLFSDPCLVYLYTSLQNKRHFKPIQIYISTIKRNPALFISSVSYNLNIFSTSCCAYYMGPQKTECVSCAGLRVLSFPHATHSHFHPPEKNTSSKIWGTLFTQNTRG